MQTIRLRIHDKVYDKLIWLLSKFNKDEIEIITEDSSFIETQSYLKNELDEINCGKAKFHSIEELESGLSNAIKKHENTI